MRAVDRIRIRKVSKVALWGVHKSAPVRHKHMLSPPAFSIPLITEDLPGWAAPSRCLLSLTGLATLGGHGSITVCPVRTLWKNLLDSEDVIGFFRIFGRNTPLLNPEHFIRYLCGCFLPCINRQSVPDQWAELFPDSKTCSHPYFCILRKNLRISHIYNEGRKLLPPPSPPNTYIAAILKISCVE